MCADAVTANCLRGTLRFTVSVRVLTIFESMWWLIRRAWSADGLRMYLIQGGLTR